MTGLKPLREKLIPASMNELDIAMEKDSELKDFITTRGKDLPESYINLIDEVAPFALEANLYYLIEQSIKLGLKCLFSVSKDGLYEGFIAYRVKGNEVNGIKMFSIREKHSDFTFQRDLKEFIRDILLPKYDKISWTAKKRNTANKSYRNTIKEFNGHQNPPFDENYKKLSDDTIIHYWIDKTNKLNSKP